MYQRLRPVSAPRMSVNQVLNQAVNPVNCPTARWMAELDQANADPSGQRMWNIYQSPQFAQLWYSARDEGERLRATVLAWLYAHQAQPGGPYPDPREPAAFSQEAILSTAARRLNVQVQQRTGLTQPPASDIALPMPQTPPGQLPQPTAWLVNYPPETGQPPKIVLQVPDPRIPQERVNFELACMLGYLQKDYGQLIGPYAPFGVTQMPTSPSAVAIFHQFAIALLCREPECPAEWTCQCNHIRARFNAPPPSHEQATDTLTLAELAEETEHWRKPS